MHGIITCLYALISFDTFINGLNAIFADITDEKVFVFSAAWVMPFILVLYDFEIKRIYKRREYPILFFIKVLVWLAFFLALLIAAVSGIRFFCLVSNMMQVFSPIAGAIYSIALFKLKCLSKPLTLAAGQDEDANNFNNLEQRLQQRRQ